jgi:hypothetical protein
MSSSSVTDDGGRYTSLDDFAERMLAVVDPLSRETSRDRADVVDSYQLHPSLNIKTPENTAEEQRAVEKKKIGWWAGKEKLER